MWVRYECHIVSVSRLLLSVTFIASGLKEERTGICHSLGGRMDGLLGYVQCWLAPH